MIARKGSPAPLITIEEAAEVALNVVRAQALIAAGRMRPPGLAAVEAAPADGRRDAAYAPEIMATLRR